MKSIVKSIYESIDRHLLSNAKSIAWDLEQQAGKACSKVLDEYSEQLAMWLVSYQSTLCKKGNDAMYDWYTLIEKFAKCIVKNNGQVPDKKDKNDIIFTIDDWDVFKYFANGNGIERGSKLVIPSKSSSVNIPGFNDKKKELPKIFMEGIRKLVPYKFKKLQPIKVGSSLEFDAIPVKEDRRLVYTRTGEPDSAGMYALPKAKREEIEYLGSKIDLEEATAVNNGIREMYDEYFKDFEKNINAFVDSINDHFGAKVIKLARYDVDWEESINASCANDFFKSHRKYNIKINEKDFCEDVKITATLKCLGQKSIFNRDIEIKCRISRDHVLEYKDADPVYVWLRQMCVSGFTNKEFDTLIEADK